MWRWPSSPSLVPARYDWFRVPEMIAIFVAHKRLLSVVRVRYGNQWSEFRSPMLPCSQDRMSHPGKSTINTTMNRSIKSTSFSYKKNRSLTLPSISTLQKEETECTTLKKTSQLESFAQIPQTERLRIEFEDIEEAPCLKLPSHAFVVVTYSRISD